MYRKIIVGLLFLLLFGCISQNANQKAIDIKETTKSIQMNQRAQYQLLESINDRNLIQGEAANYLVSYYFSPYITRVQDTLSIDDEGDDTKYKVSNILVALQKLYAGDEPAKYAVINAYNAYTWDIRLYKVLDTGSIVSLTEKCKNGECQQYYIYIDSLKGVDNQSFKGELLLEYRGGYHYNIADVDRQTIPSYLIRKKIKFSDNAMVVSYDRFRKNKSQLMMLVKSAQQSAEQKYTYTYLTDLSAKLNPNMYDVYYAQRLLSMYDVTTTSLNAFRMSRISFYKSQIPMVNKDLSQHASYKGYPDFFQGKINELAVLKKESRILIQKLNKLTDSKR